MSLRIEFRPDARIDFDEAADWYESQREGLRAEFVYSVNDALSRINITPYSFPVVEGTMLRRVLINRFPYSIIFSVAEDRILVYAVFHQSRNPMIWRGRID